MTNPGSLRALAVCTAAILLSSIGVAGEAAKPIELGLPLKCRFGVTCFVQQYFDHDPGPGAKDYRCGVKVYDGHDGTDLRVATIAEQRRGIQVVAAASGTVEGVRDGLDDISVAVAGAASVKDRECGNGVLIGHRDGWKTQYCHMAKGSVRVKSGDTIAAGTPLGLVGESGDAAFPHLHLSVRHNAEKIDPFASTSPPGSCGAGDSLWSQDAAAQLAYRAPEVINFGFSPAPVSMDDVESGRAARAMLRADSAALVAWVRVIALKQGDVQTLVVTAPDGSTLVTNTSAPLDHNKAQWLVYGGKKRTAARWPVGNYIASWEVSRAGVSVVKKQFTQKIE